MRSSGIAIILRSLRELDGGIHVSGAPFSAQALLLARLALERPVPRTAPLVVICPNDDLAAELASDIECLTTSVHRSSLKISQFPTWEQSPYSPIAPSIRSRLARIAVLAGLSSGSESLPDLILTSIPAASQATLPRAALEEASLQVQVDESVESRERLIQRLVHGGYLRVDTVEDPGTFAVRGDIVDVFPADRDKPCRIELFGDVVERVREFDSGTQRTVDDKTGKLTRLCVPPAREVLINSETVARIRDQVKQCADDLGIPRLRRDPILATVQSGNYPDHSDAWASFAYPEPARLWDHLPPDSRFVWVDELSSLQNWDEFLTDQRSHAEEMPRSAVIGPPVQQLFLWNAGTERHLRQVTRLYLDRIELADLQTAENPEEARESEREPESNQDPVPALRHRVFVRGSADLAQGSRNSLQELEPHFKLWLKQGFKILALASTQGQLERIRYLLEERGIVCRQNLSGENAELTSSLVTLAIGSLSEGFRWPAEGLVVITEGELLGVRHRKKARRASKTESGSAAKDWSGLQALSDLVPGDAVVHVDHGIGRYQGLVRLDLSGAPSDFLLLEYANKDRLYLPVYRLNVIQKYVGSGEHVALERLGSQQFARTKEKVRDAVKRLAIDLVQLYAERKIRPGIPFSPRDALFREFESKFPFDETPDQLKAIGDVLSDMESGRSMDRLVCGDVGYGKTEVAIRAAFRAVSDGKQVCLLVPTTVLAYQHEQSFKARLRDYPILVDSVSRFKSSRSQKEVLENLANGKVDIIVGTHRLLSRDVQFGDLGLIIVDEEHRFGVEHKEKLKTLKVNTHVLTLTATPIPRTLHMALAGLRDISLINTAPVDRLPIRTYVSKYDDELIRRAVQFELNRGGQVFFLHNRVDTIYQTARKLRELIPEASVGVGHGQMGEGELEEAMVSFYEKRTNILVCTTIIESGLDLPNANTIIINRADSLGLAQLYQIRGRVGRGQQRAYAYLLLPPEGAVTEDAKRRLEVIQRFVELGSGFSIASHDLEIRGGGDLLGPQQSGHIAAVGFDLYTELLEEAIQELRRKPGALSDGEVPSSREPEIKAPFPAYLAEEYVPDIHQRLSLYRRFSAATKEEEITHLEEELRDRFGPPPVEAQNLLWMIRIKQLLKASGVEALTVGPEKVSLVPGAGSRLDPVRAIALISSRPKEFQLTPDSKLVAKVPTSTIRDLYFGLEVLFREFAPRGRS